MPRDRKKPAKPEQLPRLLSLKSFPCEPPIIIAVDPTAVERRHLDVRGIIEMYMLTRITAEVLRLCSLEVCDHVGYVVAPSPDATERIYPPSPNFPGKIGVHAVTLSPDRSLPEVVKWRLPLRLRVAFANSDAGDDILRKWPLTKP